MDSQSYWRKVEVTIEGLVRVQQPRVGELVLLGSRAHDRGFLDIIQRVFDGFPGISKRPAADHVFAPARGAAYFARMGMEDSLLKCLPNPWCPRPLDEDQSIVKRSVPLING